MSYKIIIVILLFWTLVACEDVIQLDIQNNEPTLVVEGGITHSINSSDNLQTIRLSETIDYLNQGRTIPVTDASITVSDGAEIYVFSHQAEGIYTTTIPTAINRTYSVEIDYRGQQITAEETLFEVPEIDSIYAQFEEETTFVDAGYFVKIDLQDLPNMENFYHWRVFVNDSLTIAPDPGNTTNLIAKDDFFDGQILKGLKPNEEVILKEGNHVRVEQLGISEQYYDYLFQVFEQTGFAPLAGDPPPSRIRGNLFNQTDTNQFVLGYFTVAAVAEASTIVKE